MMHMVPGYRVIEYGNYGSESEADEHVTILQKDEYERFYPPQKPHEFEGNRATIGSLGHTVFEAILKEELKKRLNLKDIICHPFGKAHSSIVGIHGPGIQDVETGIGYPDGPIGAWRIFESESWRHYHWGVHEKDPANNGPGGNRNYSWVIPNYFDLDDWPVTERFLQTGAAYNNSYVLFLGRIDPCKGILTLADIIKAYDSRHPEDALQFWFAGQGDIQGTKDRVGEALWAKRCRFLGPVIGKARGPLMGGALATMMPTNFIEPFGGSGVEGMLCGTPLISVDYGAFTETNIQGVTGFRCKTLRHFVEAIENAHTLDRSRIANMARAKYSLQTCAKQYDAAFRQLGELFGEGWYSLGPRG